MADSILEQVKVDRTDVYSVWINGLTFSWDVNVLSPDKRTQEYNAIIYLTVKALMVNMGNKVGELNPIQILKYTSDYMPIVFTKYCQIALLKRGVTINSTIQDELNTKVKNTNLSDIFNQWTMTLLKPSTEEFKLNSSIRVYSFGEQGSTDFINSFVDQFVPLVTNINIIAELKPGSIVCGCTLVKLVSKKEHSEVWEALRNNRKIAMKLEPIDLDEKEIKKLQSASSFEKIVDHIKNTDREYINYQKLKDYQFKMNQFYVDYFHPLRMKVKTMSWLDGPVTKTINEDKKSMISSLFEMVFELHKRGLMFNGISPNHIMIKVIGLGEADHTPNNKYRLIDYKYITEFKGPNTNLNSDYTSLSLLSGTNSVTPYDDVESLLYTLNDLIATKMVYNDKQDEFNKKTDLSSISNLISDAIKSLRNLRQQDMYVNGLSVPPDYNAYINEIYNKGIPVNGTMLPGIKAIVGNVFVQFNEVAAIEVSLIKPDFELLKLIKGNIASSRDPLLLGLHSNPTLMNEVCMVILNYQVNGTTPTHEFMPYKDSYFRY